MNSTSLEINNLYANALAHNPNHPFLVAPNGEKYTYQAFHKLRHHYASWLRAQGIGKGDRVAVWLMNSTDWLALLFAAADLGAIIVAVNTRYKSVEVEYLLSKSKAKMLILKPEHTKVNFIDIFNAINIENLSNLTSIACIGPYKQESFKNLTKQQSIIPCDPLAYDTPLPPLEFNNNPLIFFTTSGTTKGPKLVIHTSRTIAGHANVIASALEKKLTSKSRLLAALPLCGVFGLNSALAAIRGGATIFLHDFFDPQHIHATLQDKEITHFFASDEMLEKIWNFSPPNSNPYPSLELVGFANFAPGLEQFVVGCHQRKLPIIGLYGSSEIQGLFSLQSFDLPEYERTLGGGKPNNNNAIVRVRHPDTGVLCQPNEAGELEIYTPHQFIGYYEQSEATQAAFTSDNYFKTGDLGYLRNDGSFVYQARLGDSLRLGGFLVDPTEIEQVIMELPKVKGAQIIGIEVAGKNQAVAFVISDDLKFPETCMNYLKTKLASFKIPAYIWCIDEFPTTLSANGVKIQKVKLRELAYQKLQNNH